MRIIKVDAIDSTNTFLKALYKAEQFRVPVCVVAKKQFVGKGQMGTRWSSNSGENLTFSVFIPIQEVTLQDQFFISMAVSYAVHTALHSYQIPGLMIKWPNDIMSDKQKICGILIENIITDGRLAGVVIGIGINCNQMEFRDLPRAASLQQILGRHVVMDELLSLVLDALLDQFSKLNPAYYETLKIAYEYVLFRNDKPSTFKNKEGALFAGIIKGVSVSGKLQVWLEDDIHEEFNLKEIELMY